MVFNDDFQITALYMPSFIIECAVEEFDGTVGQGTQDDLWLCYGFFKLARKLSWDQ